MEERTKGVLLGVAGSLPNEDLPIIGSALMLSQFKRALSVLALLLVGAGCSLLDGSVGQTVPVGPVVCNFGGVDGSDVDASPMDCEVRVVGGNSGSVKREGLQFSLKGVLGTIFGDVCRQYDREAVIADPTDFNGRVMVELDQFYRNSGNGWEVRSVNCEVAK